MNSCQELERGGIRVAANGDKVSLWGDEHVLPLESGDSWTTVNILKTINCIL